MLFFTREQRILLAVCLVCVCLFSAGIAYNRSGNSSPQHDLPPVKPSVPSDKSDSLQVHVAGKVKQPGVYSFKYGSRVKDAIHSAGGPTKDADVDALNLAAFLKDGEKIEVPARPQPGATLPDSVLEAPTKNQTSLPPRMQSKSIPPPQQRPAKPSADWLRKHKINLNRASREQLESLPGIGPAMADRILDYRKANGGFSSIEDLNNVTGIGPKRFATLRELVTI